MKRSKLYLSVILLLCCISVTAQDAISPSDEEIAKKREINKIKMSEEAVYADIMEIASDDAETVSAVHQKSHEMLQAHVIEVFAKRMKMSKKDVQEIWDVIDDKCQNIVVKKGDLFRVFSYIMKDAIGLGPKKPKEGDVEKYMETPSTTTATAQVEPTVDDTEVTTNEVPVLQQSEASEETVKTDDMPQEVPIQPTDSTEQTVVEAPQEAVPTLPINSVEQTVIEIPQEAPVVELQQPEPENLHPEPTAVAIEVPDKVKAMLNKSSINEIVNYLNVEKQNHTLIYGNMRTMQNPEKCYIIIIDKTTQKVTAILSQGINSRTNYVNGQQDDLNNYKGGNYSAIFVQEY